jgi:dTDP-4-dehydrorhamnose reductase
VNNTGANILITGGQGQLATELKKLRPDFISASRCELDICDKNSLRSFVEDNKITVIINTAAYTNVDGAEDDKEQALKVNTEGVKNLAELAKELNLSLVHISTDYVFDGYAKEPYTETDVCMPETFYGLSKAGGELALMEYGPTSSAIIRTSWLFGAEGPNFVTKIIALSKQQETLKVVNDQIGSPTYAKDLAEQIIELLPRLSEFNQPEIFHFANKGACSWYDFADEILKLINWQGELFPCNFEEFPTKAKRPKYSTLNTDKITKFIGQEPRFWKVALQDYLDYL